MGCGVSQFQQREPELLASKPNSDQPLLSKLDDGSEDELLHGHDNDDIDGSKEPQMKEMTEKKSGENNREVDDENRSQNEEKEEKSDHHHHHQHPNKEEDSLKYFPGSPSFREYCNLGLGSRDRRKKGIDDGANRKLSMSRMEEPPDVDKELGVHQSVKKDSRVRRLRYAIIRSMQARKSLLNASCYNPNYQSSLNNQQKPVGKPL